MSHNSIEFFAEDIEFEPEHPEELKLWLEKLISSHSFNLATLNYIFCSDAYLLQINQDYLQHDTFTDIITFDNADEDGLIEGDIFISIDRIRENAELHKASFADELHRVMAHGALHLIGFDDKSPALKKKMTEAENQALALRNF